MQIDLTSALRVINNAQTGQSSHLSEGIVSRIWHIIIVMNGLVALEPGS